MNGIPEEVIIDTLLLSVAVGLAGAGVLYVVNWAIERWWGRR